MVVMGIDPVRTVDLPARILPGCSQDLRKIPPRCAQDAPAEVFGVDVARHISALFSHSIAVIWVILLDAITCLIDLMRVYTCSPSASTYLLARSSDEAPF